jgi:hypothetical protein
MSVTTEKSAGAPAIRPFTFEAAQADLDLRARIAATRWPDSETVEDDSQWTIGPENVVLDQAGGSIAHRFHARDAHLVMSPGAGEPIPFRVHLDGEAPGPSHGVDLDEDGNDSLQDGRMYQLVRQHGAARERTLEITFLEPGAEAYAFTVG